MKRALLIVSLVVPLIAGQAEEKTMREIFPEAEKAESEQEKLLPRFILPSRLPVETIVERLQLKFGNTATFANPEPLPSSPYLKFLKEFDFFRLIIVEHYVVGAISRESEDSDFVLTFTTVKPEIMTDMELPK